MMKKLTSLVFALVVVTSLGFPVAGLAASNDEDTWSIVAHFQYVDGFEFDYTFATGVSTHEVRTYLAQCGRSHRGIGDVVHYHCYPVQE